MPAPRKYPDELRERATRMAVEARRNAATRDGAIARGLPTEAAERSESGHWARLPVRLLGGAATSAGPRCTRRPVAGCSGGVLRPAWP